MTHSRIAATLLLSACCLTAPVLLHAQPAAPPAAAAATPPSANQQAVEQRIAALQSKIGITADQQPAWASFAQAMRDNAASTDELFTKRAANAAQMSAVDNMHSYAAIARAYADNTEKLSAAFDTLYAKLSDAQKQSADALFRQAPPAPARRRK